MSNGINPYAQMSFNNPYGSSASAPSGGSGGGWLGNAFSAGLGGAGIGGVPGAAIGVGASLLTGLLGGIFGGDKEKKQFKYQKELLEMQQKERAKYREQGRQAYQGAQGQYQDIAARLFPELPMDAFRYSNPTLDNAITNALMYRMGNLFADWGMPKGKRKGGKKLEQQFLSAMNFANPFLNARNQGISVGAPTQMPSITPTMPPAQFNPFQGQQPNFQMGGGAPGGGWYGNFMNARAQGMGGRPMMF